jgi:two-component system NtrC family sensor kinase
MTHTGTRTTILIVDDEAPVCEGLALRLRRQHRVLTATTADQALATLRAEAVDVVVVDHQMPGRSGLELLRLARDRFPGTGRVMLTGHASADLAIKASNEGEVHRFLVKPVDPAELEVAVHVVLERVVEERENRLLRSLASAHPELAEELERALERGAAPPPSRDP